MLIQLQMSYKLKGLVENFFLNTSKKSIKSIKLKIFFLHALYIEIDRYINIKSFLSLNCY